MSLSLVRVAATITVAAGLPMTVAMAQAEDGGREAAPPRNGTSIAQDKKAPEHKADRRRDRAADSSGAKRNGKAAAARDDESKASAKQGWGRASATTTTRANANRKGAKAVAKAKAKARAPYTVTKTRTKTFTVSTPRFRGAIAIAQAIARAFRSKAAADRQDDPLAGIDKPRDLFREVIADAKAKARAAGPQTYTETVTDAFTRKAAHAVTAQAYSTSTALSYIGRPAFVATEDGFVHPEELGDHAPPVGTSPPPRTVEHDSGEDGPTNNGRRRCLFCEPPAVELVSAAHSPPTDHSAVDAASGQAAPGPYLVLFGPDQARLTPDGLQVAARAADEYRRVGTAWLSVQGDGDRSDPETDGRGLEERRVATLRAQLIRLGVPEGVIDTVMAGEVDHRGVAIVVAQLPAAETSVEPTSTSRTGQEKRPGRLTLSVGALYGHNFRETDQGAESDFVGAELTFNLLPGILGGVSLKQGVFWGFNSLDNGLAGRSMLSLDFAPDLGFVRPRLSANFGGLYGSGVQDGLVVGPEIAFDIDLPGSLTLRPKLAYDYQFRNSWDDWDNGIVWTGLDLGLRF